MLSETEIRELRNTLVVRLDSVIMPESKQRIRGDIELLNLILEED